MAYNGGVHYTPKWPYNERIMAYNGGVHYTPKWQYNERIMAYNAGAIIRQNGSIMSVL